MDLIRVCLLSVALALLVLSIVAAFFGYYSRNVVAKSLLGMAAGALLLFVLQEYMQAYFLSALDNMNNFQAVVENTTGRHVYVSRMLELYSLQSSYQHKVGLDVQRIYHLSVVDGLYTYRSRNPACPHVVCDNGVYWYVIPFGKPITKSHSVLRTYLYQILTYANFAATARGVRYPNMSIVSDSLRLLESGTIHTVQDFSTQVLPLMGRDKLVAVVLDDNKIITYSGEYYSEHVRAEIGKLALETSIHELLNNLYVQFLQEREVNVKDPAAGQRPLVCAE